MNSKSNKIISKIIVCYHKESDVFANDCLHPLHVGKAQHLDVLKDMTGDNTGENISHKNSSYCELTGMYWLWKNVDAVCNLIMDHMNILSDALDFLKKDILLTPSAFQLLPRKFTVRQLQNLLEAVLGVEIDNRNFRKKLFASGILSATDEFEKHVSHKPARLYRFNKATFGRKGLGIMYLV